MPILQRLARYFSRRYLLRIAAPLFIMSGAVVLHIAQPIMAQRAQLAVFDTYQRLMPRAYDPDAPVRIVDIDDATLEKLGQWPWPRTRVAELVRRLSDLGAAVIVFDIVFAEPDRTSPSQMLPMWSDVPEVKALLLDPGRLPDHDQALAQAIASANVVTGFALTEAPGGRAPRVIGTVAWGGDDPRPWIPVYSGAVSNLPAIERAAKGNGSINLAPGVDGLIRRLPLLVRLRDDPAQGRPESQIYASLVAEALRVAQGARTLIVKTAGASGEAGFGERTGLSSLKIGGFTVPTDEHGSLVAYYAGRQAQRYVPGWKVMAGAADPKEIEGRIVFIGTSAAGLMDLRSSPMDIVLPGVEAHVEAVEQIVAGSYLERPDWATGAEAVLMMILGTALAVLIPLVGAAGSAGVGALAVTAICGVSWYAFTRLHLLLDPAFPSFVAMAVYTAQSLINYLQSETERRQVRAAFRQYMSPALVEQLAANPEKLKLGGETKEMTILFCDVRGFTSISERFKENPQGLTDLINRLLTPLTDVILSRSGTIDKYMGDAIMAFWNAPLDVPDHAGQGVNAALEMFVAMDAFNERRRKKAESAGVGFKPLAVGIGVNTGDCVVGNMGSQQRFDYSVLGDSVNLASRLESQSKSYGVGLVLGQNTAALVKGRFALVELDKLAVKGKAEGIHIYTALGGPEVKADQAFIDDLKRHDAMLAHYRAQDWDNTEAALANLKGAFGGKMDGYYEIFAERVKAYRLTPPGPGWDGVFKAETK
ncbi:MAG: CHASE2 domain-containing protein [Rhodospirillales bacterium]